MIQNKGNPNSQVWVVADAPFKNDADKGWIFSSGLGYVWDKMMKEAGIDDYFVTCRRPDLEHKNAFRNVIADINYYKPPIIFPLEEAGLELVTELKPKRHGANYNVETDTEISKYCGSLLTSTQLDYPHYVIPTYSPETLVRQWKERDIVISCDLSKGATELEYWRKNGSIQPLPGRECRIDYEDFDRLLYDLDNMRSSGILSNDIETIYPREKSIWKGKHPGYPITIGLAPSSSFGISFNLFRDSLVETRELWRVLNSLFKETIQLGQNFFNFDLNFYTALGFEIDPTRVVDTLIRHHTLWPELPHKLQFQTRQYTREVYYKDEGHGWSLKDMRGLKHYNCLDVCVTREIYERQEEEFAARDYLR